MNNKTKKARFGWVFFFGGITLAASLVAFNAGREKSLAARPPDLQPISTGKVSPHIFDHLPARGVLFSKTYGANRQHTSEAPNHGDLWFRDTAGREHHLADRVVQASFSPDGRNRAYATSDHDLFIESMEGKRLAQLSRIRDYNWCSDSAAVIFSLMASVDYPDFQQTAIYNLSSGLINHLAADE